MARKPSSSELFSVSADVTWLGAVTTPRGHENITPNAATAAMTMMKTNGSVVGWKPVCKAMPLKIGPSANPVVNDSVAINAAFLPPSRGPNRTNAMFAAPVSAPVPTPANSRAISIMAKVSACANSRAPLNTTSNAGTIMLRKSFTLPARLPTPNKEISTPAA